MGMADIQNSQARQQSRHRLAWLGFAGAAVSPLVVFLAVIALRLGLVSLETALDLITLKIAWVLSWLGVIGAGLAVWMSRGAGRGGWIPAALAVLAAVATLGVFAHHFQQARAATSRPDVFTNAEDPPGFRDSIMQARRAEGAPSLDLWSADPGTCAGAVAAMTQVAPGVAGYGLQEAGFRISSLGVARADGVRTGFWFGRTYDAVLRIRPGRTDVRVTARDNRPSDEGEACRLATKILENIQVRE